MSDLAQGYSANIVLNSGDSVRISTTGQATVAAVYGAPAGTTTLNASSQVFGPYAVPAKLRLTSVSGTANYAQPTQVPVTVDQSSGQVLPAGAVSGAGLLGYQHTPVNKSDADANESAALFTLDIPANTLGPNSSLRIRTLWTVPSSAATKRLRGRFGGVVLWNMDLSTHLSYPLEFILSNRNSRSSQIAQGNNLSWAAALASTAVQTFSVDFGSAQQLTITAQWPVAGAGSNNITLESVLVQHLYGA